MFYFKIVLQSKNISEKNKTENEHLCQPTNPCKFGVCLNATYLSYYDEFNNQNISELNLIADDMMCVCPESYKEKECKHCKLLFLLLV